MLPLWQPARNSRVNVVGMPGTGKSYWSRRYCSRIRRVVTYDFFNESDELGVVYSLREFVDRAADGFFKSGVLRVVVRADYSMSLVENQELIIETILEDIKECTFYADEQGIVNADVAKCPPNLLMLAAGGRHLGTSAVFAGQRFHSQLFPVVRGTSNRIICYRQTEPDDIKDVRQRIGRTVDMTLLGGDALTPTDIAVASLPDRWFIDFQQSTGPVLCRPI